MAVHALCRLDQLAEGRGWPVEAGGRRLAVFLVDGSPRVLDNTCLHAGSPLDMGAVHDGLLVCPWHGWCYDIETGNHRTAFGDHPGVRVYPAWVEAGHVVAHID